LQFDPVVQGAPEATGLRPVDSARTDGRTMFLEESEEQTALREELRAYYADLLTDEVRAGLSDGGEGGEHWRQVVRRIGKDGWLGIGWPKEFGGQGRPATDQFIFFDETRRAGAPFPFVTINTVGPTIMRFGSEELKSVFLPGILAGEVNFAIGYTEPEAGTDLASLRTRAARDGDEYVINGAKVFTSGADMADYIWLACRTAPDAPKHKGISIVCVPTGSSGFSWSPIVTVGGLSTTATYYSDVRVPVSNRVGEENEGWRMITTQLNHERVGLAAWSGFAGKLRDEVVEWAAATKMDDDSTVIDLPWVQIDLARITAELQAMTMLNWRMATHVAEDRLNPADSSAVKIFGVETSIQIYRRLLGIVGAGAPAYLVPGSPGAVLRGRLEQAARQAQINTFGGGVNEVQREILATAGLGMTRTAR
jgi:3-oxocholest-4-en-26-oyl-CoA dehydrogenase alpha subunit